MSNNENQAVTEPYAIVQSSLSKNIENYEKDKVLFDVVKLNINSVVFLIAVAVIFMALFHLIWKESEFYPDFLGILSIGYFPWYLILVVIAAVLLLHEGIHAIFFAIYAEHSFKSVKVGFLPANKLFTPYCHCKEIIKIKHYCIAAFMPMFILGILPALLALCIGNNVMLTWGILFIVSGYGDLCFLVKLRKEKSDDLVFDLPTDAGFTVYRKRG